MKQYIFLLAALGCFSITQAQVGIGTTTPDANAILEVKSSSRGVGFPQLTTSERNAIGTATVIGLTIYNTTLDCIQVCISAVVVSSEDASWVCLEIPCTVTIKDGPLETDLITFMCHNLGADTSMTPTVPNQATAGDYFQWGRKLGVATAYTDAAAIPGWSTVAAADGSWGDGSKTVNDPCPAGFRIPSNTQWANVLANNTHGSGTNLGDFEVSATNFGSAMVLTGNGQSLILPAIGSRNASTGALFARGFSGSYWSRAENGTNALSRLYFTSSNVGTINSSRTNGFSVRCVSE